MKNLITISLSLLGLSAVGSAGENGLDGAAPKALATSAAARNTWLQLYKNSGAGDAFDSETIKGAATAEHVANEFQAGGVHAIEQTVGSDVQYKNYRSDGTILMLAAPAKGGVDVLDVASAELAPTPGTTMQFMAPDATKGGVDGEAAAQSYLGRASWCLLLASVVPRRSSSAKGAAWRLSVVGYLVIWGDATRVAAETSVRGRSGRSDDNTKSKTKTNNAPRAPAGGLAQRRALTGYVMDDDSIRDAVVAWFADQSAAETTYGHISTWETGDDGVDLGYAFYYTPCEATSCGVAWVAAVRCGGSGGTMTDGTIRTAVAAWVSNPTVAEETYGHISTWATGGVTDMSYLFCAYYDATDRPLCNNAAASFNEDIGAA
ncbi:unnamed protein product [Pelagomonas calceolata]|uniref:Uncharacterized protein n=1 Tax=Pelagomonas calceolata TaxID=35677 RepID=A0A8J2X0Q7_9STRA|nr:unnamed protein product [Pelagomonas calceolata]